MKYITVAMAENLEHNFKKVLMVYQHIGNSFE